MKNHKINFFESPNPRHFNLHNLNEIKYHLSEDLENNEEVLLATPLKVNTNLGTSPIPNVGQYFSCPQIKPKKKLSEEISEEYLQHQNIEQQPLSSHGIKEKLIFSDEQEEQLLIPITPLKSQLKKQEGAEATVRRQSKAHMSSALQTPGSDYRPAERGLKKLAAEAYRFVVNEKRTSYKQVAKRLIEQLSEEGELDVSKRGEMNIKRRVYDALNVLIALGLLKRSGNRLMIKREQMQYSSDDIVFGRDRQRRKELAMLEELAGLRETCLLRQSIILQKKRLQNQIRQKYESMKEIVEKNRAVQEQKVPIEQKIEFPLVLMNYNSFGERKIYSKQEAKQSKQVEKKAQKQEILKLWQENPRSLGCSFNSQKNIQFLGELDMLSSWRSEQKREKSRKVYKIKRNR